MRELNDGVLSCAQHLRTGILHVHNSRYVLLLYMYAADRLWLQRELDRNRQNLQMTWTWATQRDDLSTRCSCTFTAAPTFPVGMRGGGDELVLYVMFNTYQTVCGWCPLFPTCSDAFVKLSCIRDGRTTRFKTDSVAGEGRHWWHQSFQLLITRR